MVLDLSYWGTGYLVKIDGKLGLNLNDFSISLQNSKRKEGQMDYGVLSSSCC